MLSYDFFPTIVLIMLKFSLHKLTVHLTDQTARNTDLYGGGEVVNKEKGQPSALFMKPIEVMKR